MSNKIRIFVVFLICCGLYASLYSTDANAQRSKKGTVKYKLELGKKLEIKSISDVGELSDYDKLDAMKGEVSKIDWVQISTDFKLTASRKSLEWAEDVTFKWEVIIDEVGSKPLRLVKEVSYYEMELDKKSGKISVFLRPTFMERYFDGKGFTSAGAKIWARISCTVNGAEVSTKKNIISNGGKKRSDKSFDGSASKFEVVINSDKALMSKAETPFAATQSKYFYKINQDKTIINK